MLRGTDMCAAHCEFGRPLPNNSAEMSGMEKRFSHDGGQIEI